MELDKYLNNKTKLNLLRRFAALGNREKFDRKLHDLTLLAEDEKWYFGELSVIFHYIIHTFERCFNQGKISVSSDECYAFFNTGLMSSSGEELLGFFEKSQFYDPEDPESNYWFLKYFIKDSHRNFTSVDVEKPQLATYFDDYNELYFDPSWEIVISFDHIYDDNYQRLPASFQSLDKATARHIFEGFVAHTKKRIMRNNRIPVPQFYNDEVMFLIPITVFGTDTIVIALEKGERMYRANTVLSMEMAYNCARLLNKPESNWLLL